MTKFEKEILNWIASESDNNNLKTQIVNAELKSRKYTGVGCFTYLSLPKEVPRIGEDLGKGGPIYGPIFESRAVEHGGCSLLWIESGYIDCLEIAVYGSYFPEDHGDLHPYKIMDMQESNRLSAVEGAKKRAKSSFVLGLIAIAPILITTLILAFKIDIGVINLVNTCLSYFLTPLLSILGVLYGCSVILTGIRFGLARKTVFFATSGTALCRRKT